MGVQETLDEHNRPDFSAEKARARETRVTKHMKQNLQLLDQLTFVPFRRELHEVDSMIDEIVRQAQNAKPRPCTCECDDCTIARQTVKAELRTPPAPRGRSDSAPAKSQTAGKFLKKIFLCSLIFLQFG